MHTYDKTLIDTLTDAPATKRAAAITWLAAQGEAIQIEAFRQQTDLLRQKRKQGERVSSELAYSLLVRVSLKMRFEESALRMKRRLEEEEAGTIHKRRVERFKASRRPKGGPKREIIRTRYYHLVQRLRNEEQMAWRSCAAFLKKFHNFSVTYAYLQRTMLELEKLERGN